MSKLPDFTEAEAKTIDDILVERYGKAVKTEHADIEMPSKDDELVYACPAIYWEQSGCHFIIAKTGEGEFASQFFYGAEEQFNTGQEFYDDVRECLIATLRVQANHELKKKGAIE
ncbi:MAG: hypothetical protein OEY00_05910 [Gammaproteobacteria bacterium]|nr:hypothetical protein [Gammaproteobacteria bacterium]